MADIEELIKYENECVYLDFKREEYKPPKKHELLKDVMAFANADFQGDRFIIIGIKKDHQKINVFEVSAPTDSSEIQQYVLNNIKPDLDISYENFTFQGKNLMVLTIKNPDHQPYSLKRSISLIGGKEMWKENDIKIRKGSSTFSATVEDLRKMFNRTAQAIQSFDGKISFSFDGKGKDRISLKTIKDVVLPSTIEKNSLERHIRDKERLLKESPAEYSMRVSHNRNTGDLYAMSLPELNSLLATVDERIKAKDTYHISEETAHKIQLTIFNNSDRSLEDVKVIIKFPFFQGFNVGRTIMNRSVNYYISQHPSLEQSNYPEVTDEFMHSAIVNVHLGDVRHQLPTDVFKSKLRIWVEPELSGTQIKFTIILHARNLPKPLSFDLEMEIE